MDWGTWASATEHSRYVEPLDKRPGRRPRCRVFRCQNLSTHRGMASGLCLTSGCEFHMRIWVRDGHIPVDWDGLEAHWREKRRAKLARRKTRMQDHWLPLAKDSVAPIAGEHPEA